MRMIPNRQSWIGFAPDFPVDLDAPTELELDQAINLTPQIVQINASSTGQSVPTPALDALFNASIGGTADGQFQLDGYRDTDPLRDVIWANLPRGATGVVYISRFGGTGALKIPRSGQNVEVWPIQVNSRQGSALTTNQAQTCTISCAVPEEPHEDAVVAASSGVPSAPLHLEAISGGTGIAALDWDVPAFGSPLASPYYKVYRGSSASAVAANNTPESSGLTIVGTTAQISGLSTATYFFQVAAVNSAGEGARSAPVSVAITGT